MNKSAKEMFRELGYEYNYDDGFIEYIKARCIPNRLDTKFIIFDKIIFSEKNRDICFQHYKKDALCQEKVIENIKMLIIKSIGVKELQAINKQCEELGWLDNE